jgi:hypothetical protein
MKKSPGMAAAMVSQMAQQSLHQRRQAQSRARAQSRAQAQGRAQRGTLATMVGNQYAAAERRAQRDVNRVAREHLLAMNRVHRVHPDR